ncbi:MAG: class I SAM-dependent methyltransferase [Candidatus Dojkabacteria bacterium]|nr:MAG: class I SAM-dependent methyltransferase [Candidatus Dojkabacteria bacterium]
MKKDPKNYIANYEMNAYSYESFWQGREYEHQAELLLLNKIFSRDIDLSQISEVVDLGGAYGRLLQTYGNHVKSVVLADYSTKELLSGRGRVMQGDSLEKVSFLALNAYKMPFADKSIEFLLSVRVMHHLKETELFFKELSRVIRPKGKVLLEFANKNHIIAVIKQALRFRLGRFMQSGITQVSHSQESSQGIASGQESIIYNFSAKYVKDVALRHGFVFKNEYGCSFLRSAFVKKHVPLRYLLKIEEVLQNIAGKFGITPSIFVIFEKFSENDSLTAEPPRLEERLVCPICHEKLVKKESKIVCSSRHEFPQTTVGVIDLRDPRPEEIDF